MEGGRCSIEQNSRMLSDLLSDFSACLNFYHISFAGNCLPGSSYGVVSRCSRSLSTHSSISFCLWKPGLSIQTQLLMWLPAMLIVLYLFIYRRSEGIVLYLKTDNLN